MGGTVRRHHARHPTDDVSEAVEDFLTSHPDAPDAFEYGVDAQLTWRTLQVTLTFLAEETYCCAGAACHLALDDGESWLRLRDALESRGLEPPHPLKVECQTSVDEDAEFDGSCGADVEDGRPDPERARFEEF